MSENPEIRPESRITAFEGFSGSDELAADAVQTLREGLPASYRMRADRHYVDQLAAPAGARPVRNVPLAQIDCQSPMRLPDLRPLTESIRALGILQPLIVRQQNDRYAVMAGRKRFLAAQMLRLASVPCLVHDVNDTEAAAIRAADDLRVGAVDGEPTTVDVPASHRVIAAHLAALRACATISGEELGGLSRAACDLLKAHAWRATQLLAALDLLVGAPVAPRQVRGLATLVDEVIGGFAGEAALTGVTIRSDVAAGLSASGLDEEQLAAGIAGGLMATLPLVSRVSRATVLIRVSSAENGGVMLELVQHDAPVPQRLLQAFFEDDPSTDRAGGYAAVLGALAAQALAERHGGQATFEALSYGSRLTIVLLRRA